MSDAPKSTSPDGRYAIHVDMWEARMSHWIESPDISDAQSGERLLRFADDNWSLDDSQWLSAGQVRLTLRKFPGSHTPVDLEPVVDCVNRTVTLPNGAQLPLARLEAELDGLLRWP